jgi:hypothetical protein
MSSQRREITEGQNNERKFSNMKNRNTQLTAVLFVVALGLAPIVQAGPQCGGGPNHSPANEAPRPDGGPVSDTNPTSPQDEQMPVIIINSTGDVSRGKTGSFVLDMKPRLMFGAMFVNLKVSGTAIPGVITLRLSLRPTSDNPATEQSWSKPCLTPEDHPTVNRTAL